MANQKLRGWTRIKVVGDVEPIQIAVHQKTGKFGTLLLNEESALIREWNTMAEAETFIKQTNEEGMIDALIVRRSYNDGVLRLDPIRVRRIGTRWVRIDGTAISHLDAGGLYAPNAEALAAIEQKRAEHEAAVKAAQQARDGAWDIVKEMTPLDKTLP